PCAAGCLTKNTCPPCKSFTKPKRHEHASVIRIYDGLQELAPDLADCWRKQKSPRHSRGLLLVLQSCCLPAGLEADSAAGALAGPGAKDVAARDQLDPQRTVAFVVRGGARLT